MIQDYDIQLYETMHTEARITDLRQWCEQEILYIRFLHDMRTDKYSFYADGEYIVTDVQKDNDDILLYIDAGDIGDEVCVLFSSDSFEIFLKEDLKNE